MKLLLRSLLASAAVVASSQMAYGTSIIDSVRIAIANNPEIGIVKHDRRAVDQELRQARAGYLPSLDLRAAVGPEVTNSPGTRLRGPGSTNTAERFVTQSQLTLTQMLFDGFATPAEVARQRARVDSASYRVEEAAEFIAVDAVEAHLEVLRSERIVDLNEQNLDAHRRILQQVRNLEQQGGGGIADVRQAEARLANAEANYAESLGDFQDALATYQRVVGERPGPLEEDQAPVILLPETSDEAGRIATFTSPSVMLAAADVDVAQAELVASRAGFYPDVDLELSGQADNNIEGSEGRDLNASALVVLRYNLYRGGADVALGREAFHRLNEARARLRQARRDSEEEAQISYNAYQTAVLRREALEGRAEAQLRTRDAYGAQFEIGQRDLLDLLDAENELFLARIQLVTAELTEEFAVYRLLGVIGTLLDALELQAPRESISIYRSPDDVFTPERIEAHSETLLDEDAEPRPLRGSEAGEPALENYGAADAVNTPVVGPDPEIPQELQPDQPPSPGAALPGPEEPASPIAAVEPAAPAVTDDGEPAARAAADRESHEATRSSAAATSDTDEEGRGFLGFWNRVTSSDRESAGRREPGTVRSRITRRNDDDDVARYDSFGSLWSRMRGTDEDR